MSLPCSRWMGWGFIRRCPHPQIAQELAFPPPSAVSPLTSPPEGAQYGE